jgi:integrase
MNTRDKIEALVEHPSTPEGERQAGIEALKRKPQVPTVRKRLTDDYVRSLPSPAKGQVLISDGPSERGNDVVTGFQVRLTPGSRTYVYSYRSKSGRSGRYKIGSTDAITASAAREKAKELRARVQLGEDPSKDLHDIRTANNMNTLLDRFLELHVSKKKPNTRLQYEAIIKKWLRPALGTLRVTEVDSLAIERLHLKITRHSPTTANRALSVLSKLFNFAIWRKFCAHNPCAGFEGRNQENRRERTLSEDEECRLHEALGKLEDRDRADVVRMLFYTGSRRMEVLSASWNQFNLDSNPPVWRKPAFGTKANPLSGTKQQKPSTIPLHEDMVKLLRKRREAQAVNERFVFPDGKGSHITRIDKFWKKVCEAAGLPYGKGNEDRIVPHSLRHHFVSTLVSRGVSLPIAGAAVGHRSQSTTARYAHLATDSLVGAVAKVGDRRGRK